MQAFIIIIIVKISIRLLSSQILFRLCHVYRLLSILLCGKTILPLFLAKFPTKQFYLFARNTSSSFHHVIFSNSYSFKIRMNEQCPNVIIYQVCNSKSNDLSIDLANPSLAAAGYIILHITIRNQGRIRQTIFFYKVPDNLYLSIYLLFLATRIFIL